MGAGLLAGRQHLGINRNSQGEPRRLGVCVQTALQPSHLDLIMGAVATRTESSAGCGSWSPSE